MANARKLYVGQCCSGDAGKVRAWRVHGPLISVWIILVSSDCSTHLSCPHCAWWLWPATVATGKVVDDAWHGCVERSSHPFVSCNDQTGTWSSRGELEESPPGKGVAALY